MLGINVKHVLVSSLAFGINNLMDITDLTFLIKLMVKNNTGKLFS